MSINSKYYSEDIKNVKEIQFGIYTNDMIKKYSAVKNDPFGINIADSYDNYEPKKGGLVDLRLGTCDPYLNCSTCGLNSIDCDGHFGHTELAEPVFHYGFLNHLITILKCICHKCSNILIERTDANIKRFQNKSGKNRFKDIKEMIKNINFCLHCGTPVPKIKKDVKETSASIRIILEKEVGNTIVDEKTGVTTDNTKIIRDYLTPRQCYYLLRNISDVDAHLIGFNVNESRPEDMIITRFPIPPVIIRPTAKIDFLASSTMEDSLTLKIADIITWNIRVRNDMNKDSNTFNDSVTLLQFNVATYYDNDSASLPKSEFKTGNRPTRSISDRIKGKEGRMRMNLMGKRVDFSARSVITSDPNIDIDEVGVPLKIAKELTIPEEVTPQNIKYLTLLVKNGRDIYPGANYVFRTTILQGKQISQRIDLRYRKANIKLSYGDVVERHVINGDFVLFNRQPTLHKPSMMGHKVHVLNRNDINTFRMNVSVTAPYNADFDGDEMNIHLAQSVQARNELERIANVKYQIIGGKDSNPIIGCKLDSIAGAYLLSIDKMIPYDVAANLLCCTSSPIKHQLEKGKSVTGKELFSYIIPEGINLVKPEKNFHIKNGKLIDGTLNKSQLATKKNSIIHYIWDKYGPTHTQKFIDDTQRLVINYLYNKGLTVGFNDCIIQDSIIKQINEIIHTKVLSVNHMVTQFENDKDKITPDIGEGIITGELDPINANIGKMIFEILDKNNPFNVMISLSGSKGSTVNYAQIAGCLGQGLLEGIRIKKKLYGRTLPIFHQNDDTPKARGFISSNLLDGLKGHEFFFHTMSSREGLIDTAIKSVTGDTPIIIMDNNVTKRVMIGDWIDNYLDNNKDQVEHYKERDMELLRLKEPIYIPTSDYEGHVTWGEITAITRHDPGDQLYEIITHGGRQVIVTESKSLLIWNENTQLFEMMSTPDVKIGNFVPVTMNLETPPSITNIVKISSYLPKNEELSKIHHTVSQDTCILEIFELNKMNGRFIGLFLAKGNIDIENGYIQITNNNAQIQEFVKSWFDSYSIKYEETKINNMIEIKCYSIILATFLTLFLGINKSIPCEAFSANEEFITGLLDGYISENGIITHDEIQLSASKDLIEGLTMLLNRLGIFSKIHVKINNLDTINLLSINSCVIKFASKITLLDNIKQEQINIIKPSINFKTINDVVLDKIVKINLIDKELAKTKYPKVYDLTVPSTLNFGLANGLHVVDTAESGYISRKLIKSLEDLYVNYEGMIRTSNGVLVQYLFGDSGIDQQRQTELKLNLINYSDKQIEDIFIFTTDEMKKIKSKYDNKGMFQKLKSMRDNLRSIYFQSTSNYKVMSDTFMLPVNLRRITQEYINSGNLTYELDPQYIIDSIESMLTNYDDRLVTIMKTDSILLKKDDIAFKTFFTISLYEYINPKKCILEYNLDKEHFDKMMGDIKLAFSKAIVEPGEMIGIVAAQSIGEPTSQMSVVSDTQIKIVIKHVPSNTIKYQSIQIGELCNQIIKNNPTCTFNTGYVNSVETDLIPLENEYYIIGVDSFEKTHWNKISHISRHPVNGMLMTVTTKSGRTVTTTMSHSHLIRNNHRVEPIVGANLTIGMRIPVAKHIDNTFITNKIAIGEKDYILTNLFGWFIGAYLSKGHVINNTICIDSGEPFINNIKKFALVFGAIATNYYYQSKDGGGITTNFNHIILSEFIVDMIGTKMHSKKIPSFAFTAPNEFKAGLIQGYFDSQCDFQSDCHLRIYSKNKQLINDISLLLNYFDIFACMNNVVDSPIYNLVICATYSHLYQQHIGSSLYSDRLDYIVKAKHTDMSDEIDMISGCDELVNKVYKILKMERYTERYTAQSDVLTRKKLCKIINIFESAINVHKIRNELLILKQAVTSNVIWDEIVSINTYIPDQIDYVYDFTVPNNQTFMIDNGLLVHNTLNTKHHAGVAGKGSASMGVPRIKELLGYSKSIKTPLMTIYFDEKYSKSKSDTNIIASYLKHLTIGELIDNAEIYHTIDSNDDMSKMLKDDKVTNPFYINNAKYKLESMPFIIRLRMNLEKLMDKETTLLDIKTKFITYWYKNYSNLKNVRKGLKDILMYVEKLAILSNIDNIIHIRFKMGEFDYKSLTAFLSIVLNSITLKGIDNIDNITLQQERRIQFNEIGETIINKEHLVITNGINIEGLLYIKGIDHNRTKINDIDTVYRMYGIEAARKIIIDELLETFNAGGSDSLNHAHVAVLVDMMTYSGEVISIDRHGLNKVDNDPLSRASFEKTMEHFINAALFSETDKLKSISSRIALGRVIQGGTGSFDIILDTEKLKNSEYIENETGGRTTFVYLEKESLFEDLIKNGFNDHNLFIPK